MPLWQPAARHTVVIAPHPDDETLAAGGLIARLREAGCEVMVIAVTDGENCYAREDCGDVRTVEQTRALARLGVDQQHIHRLHLPDSGVHACESTLCEMLDALVPENAHMIAPWQHDFHPDHEVCGSAARSVAQAKGMGLTSYLFWTWHRGTPDLLQGIRMVRLPFTQKQQAAKREALACHRSQLAHASGEPILPANLLGPAFRDFEVYLPE